MHRSGTSAVAGALVAMGCSPPRTLMPATEQHPNRTWESLRLVELNDRILESAGSMWCDWRPLNPDWFETPVADAFRVEAQSAIDDEFPGKPLFVIKDPRICRFLPLWIDALLTAEIDIKIVIPIRHPVEVVLALTEQNGLSPYIGHLLWLRHVLDAEYFSRHSQRSLLLFDKFRQQPAKSMRQISEQLEVKWPRHQDFALIDARAAAPPDPRTHGSEQSPRSTFLSDIGAEVYEILEALSQDSSDAEHQRLDEIRAKVSAASEILGPLLAPAERLMHKQLASLPAAGLLPRTADLEYAPIGDRLSMFLPQVPEDTFRTRRLSAELEDTKERLATTNSILQEVTTRAAQSETMALENQRKLDQSLAGEREASQNLKNSIERLDAAERRAAHLQRALDQAVERAQNEAQLQQRNMAEQNKALLKCQNQLKEETVKAARAVDKIEYLSAECQRLRASIQDHHISTEARFKSEIAFATENASRECKSQLVQIGRTALDALSLALDLLQQRAYRLARTSELLKQLEQQHSEISYRLFPEWVPLEMRGAQTRPDENAAGPKPMRMLSKWTTFRLIARGDAANRNKNWPVAADCYARALKKAPSLAPIWVQYGHALKELGDRSLAEIAYHRALALEPYNWDTHLQLGHLMKMMGRTASARSAYRRSIELAPSQPAAKNELATLREPQNSETLDTPMQTLTNALEIVRRQLAQNVPEVFSPNTGHR